MNIFEKEIVRELKKHTQLKELSLEVPPEPEMGDYAFPCFALSKTLKKNPRDIAEELCRKIHLTENIREVRVAGPYLNFFINKAKLAEITIKAVLEHKDKYGSASVTKKALIEHTSINPNASPHVGRARNAIIGDAIARLLKFQGYKTEIHYYVNDVGKQIAMLVLGCKGKKNVTFDALLKVYVEINKKVEKQPKLEEEVFGLLHKLEHGDKQTKKAFERVVKTCIDGQKKIFKDLGIEYDHYDYESKYLWNKDTEKILAKLKKTGKLFVDEDKRQVLDQEGYDLAMKTPVLVLTRGDGTSLYPLRDIAYNIEKIEGKAAKNIVILGEDQKLYHKQISAALDMLGYRAPEAVHYSFVLLTSGKMSTRKGNLVLLENFMQEAFEKAEKEIRKRKKAKVSKALASRIGYGAVKFAILKVGSEKNVTFDFDTALSFEGFTGPYVQYAHARISSILRKARPGTNVDYALLSTKQESEMIRMLDRFPSVVQQMEDSYQPHLLTNYAYELAQLFNEFYHMHPVLQAEPKLRDTRLKLITAAKQVLKTSLNILGIEAPERM